MGFEEREDWLIFHYVEDERSSWNKKTLKEGTRRSQSSREHFPLSTNHEAFALSLGILKISGILRFSWYLKKKNLMFNFKIISDHPCFCFLWVISVLWKLRNSDFFFFCPSLSVGGDTQWAAFSLLCGKKWKPRAREVLSGLAFLASAFEVKMVTREKSFLCQAQGKDFPFGLDALPLTVIDLSLSRLQSENEITSLSSSAFHALHYRKGDVFSGLSEGA